MIKVLIFVLSFLGLLAGVIISFFTKEELKPGERYFMLLEKVVLLFISLVIIFYVKSFFLFFIAGVLAGFIFRKAYFYFGMALPLAFESFLFLFSSLVFVFGMPHGTLLASRLKKKDVTREIVFSGVAFFLALLLGYFLDYDPLLMMVSGALISLSIVGFEKSWIFQVS